MDKDFKNILDRSSEFRVEGKKSTTEAWDEFEKTVFRKYFPSRIITGIAAAVIIGAVLLLSSPFKRAVKTKAGEQISYYLPDSSKVILNAGSKITYLKRNWDLKRKLDLRGEAYFEVAEGKEFMVNSPNGTVKVTGTSFNVYSRKENFIVECYTGEVEVFDFSDTILLQAGSGAVLDEIYEGLHIYELKGEGAGSWINGISSFGNFSLGLVFEEFERQFEFKIIIETDISSGRFSGSFKHDSIVIALETICNAMELEYIIDYRKKTVRIMSKRTSGPKDNR